MFPPFFFFFSSYHNRLIIQDTLNKNHIRYLNLTTKIMWDILSHISKDHLILLRYEYGFIIKFEKNLKRKF